ncbi:Uncharacterized protein Rs2_34189 [Raphanus sativus]|nr:Uncharacterized protein Rs2_34189 [Raphanus sativus]
MDRVRAKGRTSPPISSDLLQFNPSPQTKALSLSLFSLSSPRPIVSFEVRIEGSSSLSSPRLRSSPPSSLSLCRLPRSTSVIPRSGWRSRASSLISHHHRFVLELSLSH